MDSDLRQAIKWPTKWGFKGLRELYIVWHVCLFTWINAVLLWAWGWQENWCYTDREPAPVPFLGKNLKIHFFTPKEEERRSWGKWNHFNKYHKWWKPQIRHFISGRNKTLSLFPQVQQLSMFDERVKRLKHWWWRFKFKFRATLQFQFKDEHFCGETLSEMERLWAKHQLVVWGIEVRQRLCWCHPGQWGWSAGGFAQSCFGIFQPLLPATSEEEQAIPAPLDLHERVQVRRPFSRCGLSLLWGGKRFPRESGLFSCLGWGAATEGTF